jgi:predicted nucleic acid-binding Zn ribbon protein
MTTYRYRCPTDGPTDVTLPFGTAPPARTCSSCGAEMPRVFTAPMLGLAPRGVVTAIDRAGASAESPAVVSRIPGSRPHTPVAPPNPKLRRLPRP